MTRRAVAVLAAFLVIFIAGAALAQKNATVMLKLLRLERKSQVFLLEASEISTGSSASWQVARDSGGSDDPALEFTAAEPKTLSFELFFDTFETKESVYDRYVKPLEGLTAIDSDLKRPPKVQVVWGSNGKALPSFEGVVESVGAKYTMFLPDGTPCRATVHLNMKAATKVSTKKQEPCP
jgi:hypothetical protein